MFLSYSSIYIGILPIFSLKLVFEVEYTNCYLHIKHFIGIKSA